MTKAVLGIIGGSGLYDLPGLQNVRESASKARGASRRRRSAIGDIDGLPIVFLSRHDKGHRLSPTDINYRANIDVLKRAGVTDLVSLSACGSFKEELPPGTFVLVDQFVDRTYHRARLVLRHGLRGACVDGASGLPALAHPSRRGGRGGRHSGGARRHLCLHRGTAILHAGREPHLQRPRLFGDRHDQSARGQARARSRDLLRDGGHGHRFRLLAPRPRRGDGAGHHQGADGQCREGARGWWRGSRATFRASTSHVRSARTGRSTRRSSPRRKRAIPSS